LEEVEIGLVDLDETGEGLNAEVGESHDTLVTRVIAPDQAIFLIHLGDDVSQPVPVLPSIAVTRAMVSLDARDYRRGGLSLAHRSTKSITYRRPR